VDGSYNLLRRRDQPGSRPTPPRCQASSSAGETGLFNPESAAQAHEFQEELDRILSSSTFDASRRSRQLLQYLAGHCLSGTSQKVNEYSIALDVFRRDASFGPDLDSIVRTETSRLRAKLVRYYRGEGCQNPLRIGIRRSFEVGIERAPGGSPSIYSLSRPSRREHHLALLTKGDDSRIAELSELLLSELNILPGLKITTPTLARSPARLEDVRTLADRVDAEIILECSIQRSRGHSSLELRMWDGRSGGCIYFDVGMTDIEAGLAERQLAARKMANDIHGQLLCRDTTLPPDSAIDVSTTYLDSLMRLRFRFKYRAGAVLDAAKFMAHSDDAMERDPHDPVTRRRWMLSLATFAYLVPSALPDILGRLRAHAENTTASSASSIEARIAAGVAAMFNREHRLAADMLYQAAELDPTNANARTALGTFLLHVGEWQNALHETRVGERLDPLSASSSGMVALSLMALGRFADARVQTQRSLSLDPSFPLSRMLLADIDLFAGNTAEALRAMAEFSASSDRHPLARGKLAYAYGVTGDSARAHDVLQELLASAGESTYAAPSIALSYLGLGEPKNALKWLRIANEQNSIADILQGQLPFFDPLRSEPGFNALIPSLGRGV